MKLSEFIKKLQEFEKSKGGNIEVVLDRDVYSPYVSIHNIYLFDSIHPCWIGNVKDECGVENPVIVID